MAWAEDGYSRAIRWLKLALPLAALGLLSTVFMLSESNEASLEIPYSNIELDDEGLVERIVEPSFAGATERGDLITFTAQSARPEGEGVGVITASDVRGQLDLRSGGDITFRADSATLDQPAGTARMRGGVVVTSSAGYEARTEGLIAYLDDTRLESDSRIDGQGPMGTFTAGRMVVTATPEGAGTGEDVQLLFTDGVKLVYRPGSD